MSEYQLDQFQSPEGDSLFFYVEFGELQIGDYYGFSPPKGIRCFSTNE